MTASTASSTAPPFGCRTGFHSSCGAPRKTAAIASSLHAIAEEAIWRHGRVYSCGTSDHSLFSARVEPDDPRAGSVHRPFERVSFSFTGSPGHEAGTQP